MTGFIYLASSYSSQPRGLEAAFYDASLALALFAEKGIPAFSPVCHFHPAAAIGGLDPRDYRIWMPLNHPFMLAASSLVVLMNDGWQNSDGIQQEIRQFEAFGRPIAYMTPGTIPDLP